MPEVKTIDRAGGAENVSRWYILNHIGGPGGQSVARREIERFNSLENSEIELFAPSYFVRETRDGKERFRKVSLAYHYVFVKGTLGEVKNLCGRENGLSFVLNRASADRYATVSEVEMEAFRIIARSYENAMPFFSLKDIDLEAGDVVEVVNGDFAGLRGTFIPRAKSKSGKIVLAIAVGSGTCAYDINVSDVRVLEFAPGTTRAHDQMEAFVPHLLEALRAYREGRSLDKRLATKLSVFVSRMKIVDLHSSKLNAKLQALLFGANTLLGNATDAALNRTLYERHRHALTNPWTIALTELIIATATHDMQRLQDVVNENGTVYPATKSQMLIAKEIFSCI